MQTGIRIINSIRQLKYSTMIPETVGPAAGPKLMIIPARPITVPRCRGEKIRARTLGISGMVIPTETPSISRPISKRAKFGANAEITVPTRKIIMVTEKSGFSLTELVR